MDTTIAKDIGWMNWWPLNSRIGGPPPLTCSTTRWCAGAAQQEGPYEESNGSHRRMGRQLDGGMDVDMDSDHYSGGPSADRRD